MRRLNCRGTRLTVRSFSILHLAVGGIHGAVVVCETLLACGSAIDATDTDGDNPLMWAVQRNRSDIVRLLLALNAATTKTDYRVWGVSQPTNAEILQLLSEHSKKTVSVIFSSLQTENSLSVCSSGVGT